VKVGPMPSFKCEPSLKYHANRLKSLPCVQGNTYDLEPLVSVKLEANHREICAEVS
jgi:hypothetical protein